MRWFWCNHAAHHSPNDLNLSAAYRIGLFGTFTGTFAFFSPLVWLGFDPKLVMLTLTMNLLYQFWIHASNPQPQRRVGLFVDAVGDAELVLGIQGRDK